MGVLNLNPFGFRFADLLVVFVGHRAGFILYHATDIDLVAEDGFHRHVVPERRFAPQIFPSLCHVIEAPWRGDFFCVELQCNLAEAVALQAQIEDVPHHGSRYRIDLKNVLVRFAFPITEGRIAANILAALEGGQLHRLDLAAGVPRVKVIHHIFQNDQHLVVLAKRVNPVIQRDETAAEGRKHKVCVLARFDVISTEAAEILAEDKIDLMIRGVLHQPVQPRTVEGRTRNAIVTVIIVQRPALFPHIAGEHFLLRRDLSRVFSS